MTSPTGEVERVADALDECVICWPDKATPDLLDDAAALLRSLAKDAERLELALATERGKLEKADAVADAWARDAARLDAISNKARVLIEGDINGRRMVVKGEWSSAPVVTYGEDVRAAIDRAIEAAGRTEGGGG
jgi:hypothetical protein